MLYFLAEIMGWPGATP